MGPPGQVATLVLPADVSWTEGGTPGAPKPAAPAAPVTSEVVDGIAGVLRSGEPAAILVGGRACRAAVLADATAVAAATGAKLLGETFPARLERGAGRAPLERIAYLAEFAAMQLAGLRHLVLVDAKSPVSFFAYPDKASDLVPDGCTVHVLASGGDDVEGAVAALAAAVDAAPVPFADAARPDRPTGALTAETVCAALGALLPEGAIVSDEGNTSGLFASGATAGAPPHDWLCLTGGAIGHGLPTALGAAVASPDRRVVALQSDGSALYTMQSLWTMAREGLDVTTILLNNRSYAILAMELGRVGAGAAGPRAEDMLDLSRPDIDFVSISQGLGVPASRATDAEGFTAALERALSTPGPNLVEAVIPPIL
jgi:acetolactate synthase-1/2/3 large subunit